MDSLRTFLDSVPEEQILRLAEPTDLDHLPTAMVLELERRQRFPMLHIENPKGFDMPVIVNVFADRARIALAAGARSPRDFCDKWLEAEENLIPPTVVDRGPVHEVVFEGDAVDAGLLPISRHFELDAGRYIGSGILVCKDPDTGVRNLSYQRLQLKAPDRFGVSMHSRGHIWEHHQRAAARNQNLEVAVFIGGHPAIYLAAAAKVAMEVDEYDLAGALLGRPVELVRCQTIDIEVPAEAEIVLEGEILADTLEDEGPYGEYAGYSSNRSTRNVFVVKAITRRESPIYLDIIPGYSVEHLQLGRSTKEPHVFQRLREVVPNVVDLYYPKSGTHFHAYVSLRKTAEGQARHALMTLLGLDHYLKLVIAVDDDVDVQNEEEVLWALATRFQADTDMFVVPKVFANLLDPSGVDGMSAKVGIDATMGANWEAIRAVVPAAVTDEAEKLLESLGWAGSP